MREQMVKAIKFQQVLEVVYMDKAGKLSKRRIKVLNLHGEKMWVWDYSRRAKRTFIVDHVLACQPVLQREREIV